MKKLIGILAVLLITATVSGQVRSASHIERQPHWVKTMHLPLENNKLPLSNPDRRQQAETTEEQIYDYGFYYTHENVEHFRINVAHFIANGRVFMPSFEPLDERIPADIPDHRKNEEIFESELFLYSKDLSKPKSEWEIASVEMIAGEYKPSNILICEWTCDGYTDVDSYMYKPDKNTDIGKVIENDDGSVEVIALVYAFENGKKVYREHIKFIFTPVDEKHYTCKRVKYEKND